MSADPLAAPVVAKPSSDSEMLFAVGSALYGQRWQRDLAADLDVNDRTIRRWVAGTLPVPEGIWVELARVMRERIDELTELATAVAVDAAREVVQARGGLPKTRP